ncbi:energy transducer TonB [Hymenobacter sp. BT559]|uniref:energy transducer TonB n=1 Tax=Hymenobacter sp. BT559 TaxID=2795729 RepID=UPI0018EC9264|nr:energy transducer TonB [Hymenobacter sp. BT559]MBJ6142730.1 energy transducer TonB [Hymenobacter sp. BT559]
MRQSLRVFLMGLGGSWLLAAAPACAQVGEGVYAAPGHLITFPHRKPPPPPPKPDAVVSPILPRFWHDEANGRERASDFYRFMSQYLKYPEAAVKAGMVGRIYVRLTVAPNGKVNAAQVVRRQVASLLAAPPAPTDVAAATASLEAETLRIFWAAKFQVAKIKSDTVTVSASYQME